MSSKERINYQMMNSADVPTVNVENAKELIREKLLSLSEKIKNVHLVIAKPDDTRVYFVGDYEYLTMLFDDDIYVEPFKGDAIRIIDGGESTFTVELDKCTGMKIYDKESDYGFLKKPHRLIEIELKEGKNIYLYYCMK